MCEIIVRRFREFIRKYREINKIPYEETISVGVMVSGGLSSSVLLDVAAKCRIQSNLALVALYLSPIKENEPNQIQTDKLIDKMANILSVNLTLCYYQIDKIQGDTLDDYKNRLRHLALEDDLDLILTGEHFNDQVEEYLHVSLTGTDLETLSGMKFYTPVYNGKRTIYFGKPFLEFTRENLNNYAKSNVVYYVDDSERYNTESEHRKYLRNHVIPVIEEKYDTINIGTTITNIQKHLDRINQMNIELKIDITSGRWSANEFINLPIGNRVFIIREYMKQIHGFLINIRVIDELYQKLSDDFSRLTVHLGLNHMLTFDDGFIQYVSNRAFSEIA